MKNRKLGKFLAAVAIALWSIPLISGAAEMKDSGAADKKKFDMVSAGLAKAKGCVSCHEGIEAIRDESSAMMLLIKGMGSAHGDPQGCVICHGGTPGATTKAEAHKGTPAALKAAMGAQMFYPSPAANGANKFTCGQSACHAGYPDRLEKSLMNTEAGKIQGNLHTWGLPEVQDYNVPWGNYDVSDDDGPVPSVGTEQYKKYMQGMITAYPKQFPKSLKQLPNPTVEEIEKDPKLAGVTYQRQQCQRCHVGVKGREKRGDYRGMGCAACHVPYSNDGFYEGKDPTINKEQPGHVLVHSIQATRKSKVKVGDVEYSGIPVETCNSCHNRGKRIGVTYQGLMEFPYGSPFDAKGNKQPKLHTKNYLFISDDLHHQVNQSRPGNPKGGLLCQDCHTSIDMHGDGNIFGTTLAQVEIECQDCHGTTKQYPWELPIGYSEEFGRTLDPKGRGLAKEASSETASFATAYDKKEGYLLTARGNPFGNVVKDGKKVVLHSATGNDFEVPVLKQIGMDNAWKSEDAKVAMNDVAKHNDKLECYTCHASWVPQCYGCHVQMNYGKDKNGKPYQDTDWVASGTKREANGQTAESKLGVGGIKSPGKAFETRSYLRWEDPVIGVNGEGRITPLMPGCQVIWTVIDREGKTLVNNKIARSPDEAKAAGQTHVPLAIDMAPVQPHSAQRKARTCESCHNNPKTVGYGIGGGVFMTRNAEDVVEDLIDQKTGKTIPQRHSIQISKIPDLTFDLSTIIDKDGNQVQTVGTHWPASRALPKETRDAMLRTGLCMGCHREMSKEKLWASVSTPGSLNDAQHIELMNKMFKAYAESKDKSAPGAKAK